MKKITLPLVLAVGVLLLVLFLNERKLAAEPAGADPLNASYKIDRAVYRLENGHSEQEAAPGSASKIITATFGQPVYRDLDDDGDDDAVLFLTQSGGGSGTFFYAAAAIKTADGYAGTNAIFLGDRIAPQTITAKNGILIANYADRAPGEPMTDQQSVGRSKYARFSEGELKEISGFATGEQFLQGYLVAGHEARSFVPCGEAVPEYWIMGDSPALQKIISEYQKLSAGISPYAQIFATLIGKITPAPTDGFGADYEYGIRISQLAELSTAKNCKSDLIAVDAPKSGTPVSSPLTITGRARGTWFFEASFPVILTDWDGKIIAQSIAEAQGEWMTEKFVPFSAVLSFEKPEVNNNRGFLILKKDNPSGLPEHDDALEIPVLFR